MIIPLKAVRILGQTTTVDLASSSQFGSKTDAAVVRTQLLIENDQAEMSLPLAFLTTDADESNPPVVRVGHDKRQMSGTLVSDVDRQAFMQGAVAAATAAGAPVEIVTASLSEAFDRATHHHKTFVTLRQGEKLMLEFVSRSRVKIDPATRTGTFKTLAPLPQYQLAAGGTLWIAVALPRPLAGLGVNLLGATEGFNRTEYDVLGRKLVAWQWQNDPLLELTYQYA